MPKEHRPSRRLRGKVLAFNISPKGHIEGALIETADGHAQINFPKHDAGALAQTMRVGSKLDIVAELEPDEGEHPVYRAADAAAEASGTIVRLNYALHGEVNGYHLDDKTFLHVKPEGAKKHKLRIGEKVKATGSRRAGADAVVLEVRTLERVRKRHDDGARV
jgi:hypothetical protein